MIDIDMNRASALTLIKMAQDFKKLGQHKETLHFLTLALSDINRILDADIRRKAKSLCFSEINKARHAMYRKAKPNKNPSPVL